MDFDDSDSLQTRKYTKVIELNYVCESKTKTMHTHTHTHTHTPPPPQPPSQTKPPTQPPGEANYRRPSTRLVTLLNELTRSL